MIRQDMKFDVRTMPHRLRRRELTPEGVEEHLASLPDEAAEAEETRVSFSRHFEDRHRSSRSDRG